MAQERCFNRTFQYHRLWTPGEIRTADVDDAGKPVASDHFRLVEGEEEVEERNVFSDEKVKEARQQAGQRDKRAAIERALYDLDPDDDSHWTRAGDPAIQAVFGRVDFEVTRNEIRSILPDFDRAFAKDLKTS